MKLRFLLIIALTACTQDVSITKEVADADGDGFPADLDCDDDDAAISPSADERCDGVDQDCDGEVDEYAIDPATWYTDADTDGYGDLAAPVQGCTAPQGAVVDATDCNDADAAIHPDAAEPDCTDPVDYNCDNSVGYADIDADGAAACEDCDDTDATRFPGATEVCNSLDDDCDTLVDDEDDDLDASTASLWYVDADTDSYGDPALPSRSCVAPAGTVADSTDCDDAAVSVNPGATERCNEVDDDCDSAIDEDVTTPFYADADGDSFGDSTVTLDACAAPPGWVSDTTDCDDTDAAVNPAGSEVCNGIDDECDTLVDDSDPSVDAASGSVAYADTDADTYGDPATGAWACSPPAGSVTDATDCDDADATVNPGAIEVCDGADDDCDTLVDDADPSVDPTSGATWYADTDTDSFGDPAVATWACSQPAGTVADATDCDDGDAAINSAASEVCNGVDDDCDTLVDDADPTLDSSMSATWYADTDLDGYGDATSAVAACDAPAGYVAFADDCDDSDVDVNPGAAETCDGVDEDCDGAPDDGAACPCTTDSYGGHAYQFCTSSLDWDDARAACVASGYDLMTLDDAAENVWAYDRAMGAASTSWWLGFNDLASEGSWVWADGSAVAYTNWAASQPDNGGGTEHCGHYGYGGSYLWNDDQCYNTKYYVCESG